MKLLKYKVEGDVLTCMGNYIHIFVKAKMVKRIEDELSEYVFWNVFGGVVLHIREQINEISERTS